MAKGYVHVLTGNGKGKTTAAFGLAVRAIGRGARVFIGQFLKRGAFGEVRPFHLFGESAVIRQFGTGRFIRDPGSSEDKAVCKHFPAYIA